MEGNLYTLGFIHSSTTPKEHKIFMVESALTGSIQDSFELSWNEA